MQSRFSLVMLTLVAGCGATSSSPAEQSARTPDAIPVTTPPVAPPAPAAKPIHISENTERLDYELTIPADAVALPKLKARLIARSQKAKAEALAEQADYMKSVPDGPASTFGVQTEWVVVGQTPQLLSLVANVSGYSGGAHGSAGTTALLWDRAADREVSLTGLFTDRAKALATIRSAYCKALNAERLKKIGSVPGKDSVFPECPSFDELTVAPAGTVGGKFSRILVTADPYVAGSWAEGAYEVELVIPKAMIPFVAAPHRAAFPG